jgi:creatinine amidohydrolase
VTVRWSDLAWPDLKERLRAETVVFVPCGAIEQHGPHLPLEVDAFIARALSEAVATEVGGLVVPTLSYGYRSMPKSGGGPGFPGTLNLQGATLADLLRDVLLELARHGVRRVCVIDAHYENQWMLTEGIEQAIRLPAAAEMRVMRLEYWDFVTDELLAQIFPDGFPGIALEHAAVLETSLMMHLDPARVRVDRIPDNPPAEFPPYDIFPAAPDWVPSTGALTSAKAATAEKGELLFAHYVTAIAAAVRREFPAAGPSG